MPCLNESETLPICIKKASRWLKNSNLKGEILIADNGSNDGSQKLARSFGARVLDVPEKGYGNALYYGAKASYGKWIIMGDSDNSYDFSNLDFFIVELKKGYDLVVGNRFLGGIENGAMPWKNKYIGNPVLSFIGRLLFNLKIKDFHCGLRGITKKAFNKINLTTTGMEFASEMIIKAHLFKMKITEVPTTLSKDGRSRSPHLRPWRDGWRHLRFMMLFNPKWLFIIPGLIITIIFFVLYFFVLFSPIRIKEIEFDVNTLFFLQAGFHIGNLFLIFGLITKIIGNKLGLFQDFDLTTKFQNSNFLEIGGLIGLIIILSGLIIAIRNFIIWKYSNFGFLEKDILLRSVSLSTLLIIFGATLMIASLIIGFLSLPTKRGGWIKYRKSIS
jgi:glycosyltransferase involved in cell wall biosynthesis